MPSTTTRFLLVRMRSTRPVLPRSEPEITITWSPVLMCLDIVLSSNHFAGQGNDLHEILVTQLAGNGAENSGAARVVFLVDHHGGVAVKADVAAVGPHGRLLGANDDAADDLAVFDLAAGHCFLH